MYKLWAIKLDLVVFKYAKKNILVAYRNVRWQQGYDKLEKGWHNFQDFYQGNGQRGRMLNFYLYYENDVSEIDRYILVKAI